MYRRRESAPLPRPPAGGGIAFGFRLGASAARQESMGRSKRGRRGGMRGWVPAYLLSGGGLANRAPL
jgi:hypothetical protein